MQLALQAFELQTGDIDSAAQKRKRVQARLQGIEAGKCIRPVESYAEILYLNAHRGEAAEKRKVQTGEIHSSFHIFCGKSLQARAGITGIKGCLQKAKYPGKQPYYYK